MKYSRQQIASAQSLCISSITYRANAEGWTYEYAKENRVLRKLHDFAHLPRDVQLALRRAFPGDFASDSSQAARHAEIEAAHTWYVTGTATQRARADRAADALRQRLEMIKRGASVELATQNVASFLNVSRSTLYGWAAIVGEANPSHYAALLMPQQKGSHKQLIHGETWRYFASLYLRASCVDAAECYRQTRNEARAKGWPVVPALRTFQRRVASELDPAVIVLKRKGERAVLDMYPSQQRDRSMFAAMDALCADGHKLDVWVRTPCRTRVVRPMLIGWYDLYSNKIVGWRLSETESAEAVRLSFLDTLTHSLCKAVYLDNGRGFAGKVMTGGVKARFRFKIQATDLNGVFNQLGVAVHFSLPRNGRAKPIERAWRDLATTISKHQLCDGAYTGNCPDNKPYNVGEKVIEWDAMRAHCATQIAEHNARDGRRTVIADGRSFDAVFAESMAKITPVRVTKEQRHMVMLASEPVTVDREEMAVWLHRNKYHAEALRNWHGQRIVLRVDPDDLHAGAYAYDVQGVFIGALQCVGDTGFNDTAAAKLHARAQRKWLRGVKEQADATQMMSLAQLQRQPELGAVPSPVAPARVVAAEFALKKKQSERTRELLEKHENAVTDLMAERARRAGMA